jgi:scyllo-inositol 2-dehydrogenase (NAD+)
MLKAAVIGCGRMGAEPAARLDGLIPAGWLPMSHAECLQATAGVELAALADTDQERLTRHAKYYGIDAVYTDYRRLLEEVRPDIVTIATRTPIKCEIMRDACALGVKALYVEKPIANSLESCRAALTATRKSSVALGYGVNRRYHAAYRRARQMILAGDIGDVVEIAAEFGRAQMLWTHPHSVDLMLFLLGSTQVVDVRAWLAPATVYRKSELVIDSDPVIEHAFFSFESGATAAITKTAGCNLHVAGTRGNLTVHADGSYIQLDTPKGAQRGYFVAHTILDDLPAESATLVAFRELLAAAGKPDSASVSPAEIETGLTMLLACAWSHLCGGSVRLADVPADLLVTGKYHDRFA